MLTLLEKDSTLTLREIANEVEKQFEIVFSISSIKRVLDKMDHTWKVTLPIPITWNTPQVILARKNFVSEICGLALTRSIFYVDEQGYNLNIRKSRGRSLQGERATVSVLPKSHRISLIACMGSNGIVFHKVFHYFGEQQKGVSAESFRNFLIDSVNSLPRNALIVLDNAKIHSAESLDTTWTMLRETYLVAYRLSVDNSVLTMTHLFEK
jgi:hypothetical protein